VLVVGASFLFYNLSLLFVAFELELPCRYRASRTPLFIPHEDLGVFFFFFFSPGRPAWPFLMPPPSVSFSENEVVRSCPPVIRPSPKVFPPHIFSFSLLASPPYTAQESSLLPFVSFYYFRYQGFPLETNVMYLLAWMTSFSFPGFWEGRVPLALLPLDFLNPETGRSLPMISSIVLTFLFFRAAAFFSVPLFPNGSNFSFFRVSLTLSRKPN